jgi:RHS repeat-associated protein
MVASTSGGSVSNGGFAFPAYTQSNTYDADGNLTSDGIWTYEWDPENRLAAMSMTNITNVANSNRLRLEFAYDGQNRRITKLIKTWNGSTFAPQSTNRFVYDGWNELVALNPQSSALQAFLWGEDLSGSIHGAEGIGGMIASLDTSNGQISNSHFVCFDGNGNVTGLVNASNANVDAKYEYTPFGLILRSTANQIPNNVNGFSTKCTDMESGLSYYGNRYYCPGLGRFLSQDRIGQDGGVNLYGFVYNSPIASFDTLGDAPRGHHPGLTEIYRRMERLGGGPGAEIIKYWTIDFNPNHLAKAKHNLYNGVAWSVIEEMMAEKGFGSNLDAFLKAMNNDVQLTLDYAGRICNSPGMRAYNGWVARGGISTVAAGLGASVGRMAKAGAKALPAVGVLLGVMAVNAGAADFTQGMIDRGRHIVQGETTWAEFDSLQMAVGYQTMTGNYYGTQFLLGQILE